MRATSLLYLLSLATGQKMVADQPATPFLQEAQLTVHWEGIPPSTDPTTDWVSLWWAPFAATYIQYANITDPTGSGSAQFLAVNGRHPFFFRYYRGDKMLAQSNNIVPEGSYPMQVRVSLVGDDVSSLRVSWTTNSSKLGVVKYGLSPDDLSQTASTDNITTYSHDELNKVLGLPNIPPQTEPFPHLGSRARRCGHDCYRDNTSLLLWVDPGYFHNVQLDNLQPSTKYYYRVGDENGYMSEVFYFWSRTPAGSNDTVTFLYVADGGIGGNGNNSGGYAGGATNNDPPANGADGVWKAVISDLSNDNDDIVLFNGDISYARGWPWTWEVFYWQTSPFLRHIPAVASFGNHEMDYAKNGFVLARGGDSGGEAGIVAARRFNMLLPTQASEAVSVISYGSVSAFTLSSEHDIVTQSQTLASLLASVDRTKTPWVVVQVHRPLYSSSVVDATGDLMKLHLLPLFEKYNVDVVLCGHQHFYERMCAIKGGECDASGPTYIVDGSSGAESDPTSTPSSKFTKYKEFSVWGYSRLIANRESLTWAHFHTNSTDPVDQVTLQK